jgi:hypothetical protein
MGADATNWLPAPAPDGSAGKVIQWPRGGDPAGSPPDIPLGRPVDGEWLLYRPSDPTTLTCSDYGNGERFSRMYKGDAIFVHELNAWHIYDGRVFTSAIRPAAQSE